MNQRSRLHSCPLGAPPCPICRARSVEELLERGHADMALSIVRGLADDMIEFCGQREWRAAQQMADQVRYRRDAKGGNLDPGDDL